MAKIKKIKTFNVVRIVKEEYQVEAHSKEDAKNNIQDPHTVTVMKEKITLADSN